MIEVITSLSNAKIKEVRSLKDKKARYETSKFVVEGLNIVKDIPSNIEFDLFFTEEREELAKDIIPRANTSYKVSTKVMQSISDTITPSGLLAVATMNNTHFKHSNRVLYLDGITDPGNMGTIIRTAVAIGIEDIIADSSVDVYSSKVIRASMGGIFNTNIISVSGGEGLELIKDYKVYALDMNGENIFDKSFTMDNSRFVLAVGSEAHGITEKLKERADKIISLPMTDKIESLNAGVSLSTALYRIVYL